MKCKNCRFYQPWSVGGQGACDEIILRNPVEYLASVPFHVELESQYMEVPEDFFCGFYQEEL